MLNENLDARGAAASVGYESTSQFSREYRRLFGAPPHRDVTHAGRSWGPSRRPNLSQADPFVDRVRAADRLVRRSCRAERRDYGWGQRMGAPPRLKTELDTRPGRHAVVVPLPGVRAGSNAAGRFDRHVYDAARVGERSRPRVRRAGGPGFCRCEMSGAQRSAEEACLK